MIYFSNEWYIIKALRKMLRTNTIFADYVDDVNEADHKDGFGDSNDRARARYSLVVVITFI
jgi:hypothetical protein